MQENRTPTTQRLFAETIGISQSHLSLILSGRRIPSLKVAKRLADALGVTVDSLLTEIVGKVAGEEKVEIVEGEEKVDTV